MLRGMVGFLWGGNKSVLKLTVVMNDQLCDYIKSH